MTHLALTNISKQFAQTTVVQDFNLDVKSASSFPSSVLQVVVKRQLCA